jgi:hypothetical protein
MALASSYAPVRRSRPFDHLVATDVFDEDLAAALADQFRSLLRQGRSETPDTQRFSRNMGSFDAYSLSFTPDFPGPLSVFTSRWWYDHVRSLFPNVDATGEVNGGLHHHRPGSRSGKIHNDLNPGWFPLDKRQRPIVSDEGECSYYSGAAHAHGIVTRQRVRSVAMLYYLANDASRLRGGETGLYDWADQAVDAPTATVPPVDNSMLLFECTPYSYHSFLGNEGSERNSVILWLHGSPESAHLRWGRGAVVPWPGTS